ncbi:MAG: hypothetical protein DME91_09815 [Verrucomicrobia bacterium]|nr:MAG: hypothetical protein DME91_09815 [Verrucomicrobiota bacterium]
MGDSAIWIFSYHLAKRFFCCRVRKGMQKRHSPLKLWLDICRARCAEVHGTKSLWYRMLVVLRDYDRLRIRQGETYERER